MTWSFARRALLAALIAAVSSSGCRSSRITAAGCASDQECRAQFNDDDRAFCDVNQKPPTCGLHPRQCDTAANCCPGQACNAQGHYCFDKYTACTLDGSCPVPGQICKEIGVFAKGLGCTFAKCGAAGSCGEGTTCFNKYCVGGPPCNGGCTGTNTVCITATNFCSPPPKDVPSCAQTCDKGKILVLTNPDNIFDTCVQKTETCQCESLPPIQVRDVSRHSSLAASGQNLYVTAYDGDPSPGSDKPYGDLVIHTFDKSDLTKPQKTEWLDGVPAVGHIGGDVNGPRHGITDPGPDVGQYTSIAASPAGDLYVAYYDVDNGDLKFTARYGGPAAQWTAPMTVDGSTPVGSAPTNGDVGMYASLALDKNGIPAIAYFRRSSYDAAAAAETGRSTALVYAVAKRTQPLTAADWQVVGDVEQATRPPPPCNNACTSAQICVLDENAADGERCAEKSIEQCDPGCTGNEICVLDTDANQSSVCRATRAPDLLPELPRGTGLMPQLGFIDDHPVIAYYDSLHRAVKAVMGTGAGATPNFGAPVEIDGHDAPPPAPAVAPRPRDTGRWPALAIGSAGAAGGRIAIAFADLSAQQLLLYQSDSLTAHSPHAAAGAPGRIHVVDDGKPAAGETWHPQSFPGVQTSIAFTPTGKIALAYQDATPVDLIFSVYDPAQNKSTARSTLRGAGASGFWPKMVIVSGTAYVSSASIKAVAVNTPFNQLFVDAKPAP
jgi:hypothetical protein